MKISEIIEVNKEIMLFRKLNQETKYEEYTKKIKQNFKELRNEIEKIENIELRERILDMLVNYQDSEGGREGYVSIFAFKQGVKLGLHMG